MSGRGLGDNWATYNWAINEAIKSGAPTKLSYWYYNNKNKIRDCYERLTEIRPLFSEYDDHLEFSYAQPTKILKWYDVFKSPYFPTDLKWKPSNYNKICYQFDGKTHRGKNNPPELEEKFLNYLEQMGYNIIRLGWGMTLSDAVEHLSTCNHYYGVDSGFTHIAISVGCPITMVRNDRTEKDISDTYTGKMDKFTLKHTLEDAMKD